MHSKKRIASVILIFLLAFGSISPVMGHSGGTDSNGGHYDHSTGEYHYHHGMPAHQHNEDGSCPYDEPEEENIEYDEDEYDYYQSSDYNDTSYEQESSSESSNGILDIIREWNYIIYPAGAIIIIFIIIILNGKRNKVDENSDNQIEKKAPENENKIKKTSENKVTPQSKNEKLIALLKTAGVTYIDNRSKNGCLWIVGGEELIDIVAEARRLGFVFRFKKEGGRATHKRPGWWTKNQ